MAHGCEMGRVWLGLGPKPASQGRTLRRLTGGQTRARFPPLGGHDPGPVTRPVWAGLAWPFKKLLKIQKKGFLIII